MKLVKDPSQIVGDDNNIQTTNPSNSKALDESDLAEIEQIVKEKMVSETFDHHSTALSCTRNFAMQFISQTLRILKLFVGKLSNEFHSMFCRRSTKLV